MSDIEITVEVEDDTAVTVGLTGAQGPTGPEGSQGEQGPAGADGADGADGLGVPDPAGEVDGRRLVVAADTLVFDGPLAAGDVGAALAPIVDTAANLAGDNPTPAAGQWASESDTGLAKLGDGTTAYNDLTYVGARELDSAETDVLQSGITGTSGSPTDITGLQISFDVVARPVKVVFEHPYLVSVTAAATPFVRIRNVSDGATIAESNTAHSTAASQFFAGRATKRIVTPGSYNWKAAVWRAGAGTLTSLNDDGIRIARLWAEEL